MGTQAIWNGDQGREGGRPLHGAKEREEPVILLPEEEGVMMVVAVVGETEEKGVKMVITPKTKRP